MLSGSLAWLDFEFKEYKNGVCTAEDRLALKNGSENVEFTWERIPGPDGFYYEDSPPQNQWPLYFPGYTGFGTPFRADDVDIKTLIDGSCSLTTTGSGGGDSFAKDMSGSTNQYVANYSGSLSLSYEDIINGDTPFIAAIDMNFTGDYHPTQNLDESVKQEGYEIYNLRLSVTPGDGNLNISVIGRNIFDQKVISYANDVPLATSQFGTMTKYGFLQRTKTWGIQARYNL